MAKSRSIRKPEPTTDRRTPEERLEAFVREKYADRAERMWARILDGLDAVPEPAPWISAARTLSERLIISEDAFYWFVEGFTECLVLQASQSDPMLLQLREAMQQIERAHGLRDGEFWEMEEAPSDWRALSDEWQDRAEAIVNEALRGSGNADVAQIRESNPSEYESRVTKGGDELWHHGDDDEEPTD
jgi:hypothetical protein